MAAGMLPASGRVQPTTLTLWICGLHAGVTARQRKDELERLNEQLRKINMSLRQQARIVAAVHQW